MLARNPNWAGSGVPQWTLFLAVGCGILLTPIETASLSRHSRSAFPMPIPIGTPVNPNNGRSIDSGRSRYSSAAARHFGLNGQTAFRVNSESRERYTVPSVGQQRTFRVPQSGSAGTRRQYQVRSSLERDTVSHEVDAGRNSRESFEVSGSGRQLTSGRTTTHFRVIEDRDDDNNSYDDDDDDDDDDDHFFPRTFGKRYYPEGSSKTYAKPFIPALTPSNSQSGRQLTSSPSSFNSFNTGGVPLPRPIQNTGGVPLPRPIYNTGGVPLPQPIHNTGGVPLPQPIHNAGGVHLPQPIQNTGFQVNQDNDDVVLVLNTGTGTAGSGVPLPRPGQNQPVGQPTLSLPTYPTTGAGVPLPNAQGTPAAPAVNTNNPFIFSTVGDDSREQDDSHEVTLTLPSIVKYEDPQSRKPKLYLDDDMLSQYYQIDNAGSIHYGYELENHYEHRTVNTDGSMKGSYGFDTPGGGRVSVNYVAGDRGFRVVSSIGTLPIDEPNVLAAKKAHLDAYEQSLREIEEIRQMKARPGGYSLRPSNDETFVANLPTAGGSNNPGTFRLETDEPTFVLGGSGAGVPLNPGTAAGSGSGYQLVTENNELPFVGAGGSPVNTGVGSVSGGSGFSLVTDADELPFGVNAATGGVPLPGFGSSPGAINPATNQPAGSGGLTLITDREDFAFGVNPNAGVPLNPGTGTTGGPGLALVIDGEIPINDPCLLAGKQNPLLSGCTGPITGNPNTGVPLSAVATGTGRDDFGTATPTFAVDVDEISLVIPSTGGVPLPTPTSPSISGTSSNTGSSFNTHPTLGGNSGLFLETEPTLVLNIPVNSGVPLPTPTSPSISGTSSNAGSSFNTQPTLGGNSGLFLETEPTLVLNTPVNSGVPLPSGSFNAGASNPALTPTFEIDQDPTFVIGGANNFNPGGRPLPDFTGGSSTVGSGTQGTGGQSGGLFLRTEAPEFGDLSETSGGPIIATPGNAGINSGSSGLSLGESLLAGGDASLQASPGLRLKVDSPVMFLIREPLVAVEPVVIQTKLSAAKR